MCISAVRNDVQGAFLFILFWQYEGKQAPSGLFPASVIFFLLMMVCLCFITLPEPSLATMSPCSVGSLPLWENGLNHEYHFMGEQGYILILVADASNVH